MIECVECWKKRGIYAHLHLEPAFLWERAALPASASVVVRSSACRERRSHRDRVGEFRAMYAGLRRQPNFGSRHHSIAVLRGRGSALVAGAVSKLLPYPPAQRPLPQCQRRLQAEGSRADTVDLSDKWQHQRPVVGRERRNLLSLSQRQQRPVRKCPGRFANTRHGTHPMAVSTQSTEWPERPMETVRCLDS